MFRLPSEAIVAPLGRERQSVARPPKRARSFEAPPSVVMSDEAAAALEARRAQPVAPELSIAVKRDVHVFEVDAPCDTFARAFAATMAHPESTFGVVRIKRPRARVGRSFEVGERFQGGFSVALAVDAWLRDTVFASAARAVLGSPRVAALVTRIEDAAMSDYGEVRRISAGAEGHTLQYGYLEGTPIAGGSTFTVEPLGAMRCRVTQILEYQEIGTLALETFQRFGLKLHDRAVFWQITHAAAALGAKVTRSTIPAAYA